MMDMNMMLMLKTRNTKPAFTKVTAGKLETLNHTNVSNC